MNNTNNPSALYSKKLITEALIELMQKKFFSDITISEISLKAGVVRRTFYRNFDSKEEVLSYYMDTLIDEYKNRLMANSEFTLETSIRILFGLCYENKVCLLTFKKSGLLGLLLEKWNTTLPILHSLVLDRLKNFPYTKNEQTLSYLLTFNVGGVFNMIIKWINDDMVLSPDELADIVESFAFNY